MDEGTTAQLDAASHLSSEGDVSSGEDPTAGAGQSGALFAAGATSGVPDGEAADDAPSSTETTASGGGADLADAPPSPSAEVSANPDGEGAPNSDEAPVAEASAPQVERPAFVFDESAPRSARIIALANQKGGVGKTTSTISLAAALAERGAKVLIVDFDPQGGCALGLGIEPGGLDLSVYDALLDRNCRVEDAILKTSFPNLELLPSNIDLSAAELMLVQEVAREQTLMRVLAPLRVNYNFILIDCPPSLGLLTINALTAADGVIVPLECEYYALRGMGLLMNSIDKIRERLNPSLHIDGIVATMVDGRTLHSKEVLERVREAFGPTLFRTVIRKTIRFAEAPVVGEPILSYAPKSAGAAAYRDLAQEVIDRVATRKSAGS